MDLFKINYEIFSQNNKPLSERMRPNNLKYFFGQDKITNDDSVLKKMIDNKKYYSMILYGPPGSGKTTIANIIENNTDEYFVKISAVGSGTKELNDIITIAKEKLSMYNKKTIVFIDEIHRFNKLQQDYLLGSVESGDIILIGATTENPYYAINSALVSRTIIIELEKLNSDALKKVIDNCLKNDIIISKKNIMCKDDAVDLLIKLSNGDSRTLLNYLEIIVETLEENGEITTENINKIFDSIKLYYDKNSDSHYDYTSAFIKSMRVGDSDATIYYLACMLLSGEDINFIARRMIIFASEDIGNANPDAIVVASSCANSIKIIGLPESRIILSQCALYLANSLKSNSSYKAINTAMDYVKKNGLGKIPSYLQSTVKINNESSEEYKYPHDYENMITNQRYLPENVENVFYIPKDIGYESNYIKKDKED